jgi:hypothetical protein
MEVHRIKKDTKDGNNPFTNWKSSYSEDFPQKEIMTLDLITAINKEKENERTSNYDDLITYNERETCVIAHNEELPDHLHFKKPNAIDATLKYSNLYSGLDFCWNHD